MYKMYKDVCLITSVVLAGPIPEAQWNINIHMAILFPLVVTEMLHNWALGAVWCFPSHEHYIRHGITK